MKNKLKQFFTEYCIEPKTTSNGQDAVIELKFYQVAALERLLPNDNAGIPCLFFKEHFSFLATDICKVFDVELNDVFEL